MAGTSPGMTTCGAGLRAAKPRPAFGLTAPDYSMLPYLLNVASPLAPFAVHRR